MLDLRNIMLDNPTKEELKIAKKNAFEWNQLFRLLYNFVSRKLDRLKYR